MQPGPHSSNPTNDQTDNQAWARKRDDLKVTYIHTHIPTHTDTSHTVSGSARTFIFTDYGPVAPERLFLPIGPWVLMGFNLYK